MTASQVRSLATDAVEDGIHTAKRTIKAVNRHVDDLRDLKDEAVHRVRREPFKAVAFAGAAALILGVALGWVGGRLALRNCRDS